MQTTTTLPRLFQWAGGKTKMLNHYKTLFPSSCEPLVEPFAGGAALFSYFSASAGKAIDAYLGDTNQEIMGLYTAIRDDVENLIKRIEPYDEAWKALEKDSDKRKQLYYTWRSSYWRMTPSLDSTAILYALMRTSFNGIWQTCEASQGRFGTPVGLTNKKGGFLYKEIFRTWSRSLQNSHFHYGDFETMRVPKNAFVFCDPPYRNSFTSYGTGFNDDDQRRLIAWCQRQHKDNGARVWLANRDADDGFFEKEALGAMFHRFPIVYTAGRRKKVDEGFEAKPATEILMRWE